MENPSQNISLWATFSYFILSFYMYGATVVEVFVYYPSWIHIHDNWIAFKQGVDLRLIILYVIPTNLLLIPLIIMFWYRIKAIPKWAIWVSLILFVIPLVSTFLLQLPIQLQLAKGWDKSLYHTLISSEWLTRQIWTLLGFILNGFMLLLVMKSALKTVF